MEGNKLENNNLNNRKIQANKTKNEIFNIATSLIKEKGYHNVTVSEICKKANVAKGTFYHHFSAKEDIIVETYKETDVYFKDVVENKITTDDSIEQIKEFIRYQVIYAETSNFDYVKEVYKSQIDSGNTFFISTKRPIFKLLKNFVKKAQNEKKLTKEKSAKYITKFLLRFSRGMIYDWCLHDGEYNLQKETIKHLEEILKIFLTKNNISLD